MKIWVSWDDELELRLVAFLLAVSFANCADFFLMFSSIVGALYA